MKGFTFYNNYYELIKYLPNEDRYKMYDAIFQYMFDDKEPTLEGLTKGLWVNIKMPLDTSKNNGGRGGRKKTEKKPIKNRLKTDKVTEKETNNNISYFLFLISNNKYKYINKDGNIYQSITKWLEYKQERRETYKEKGLESLLTQIDKQCDEFGEDKVVNLINECMASNYKGIIFDKLKKDKTTFNTESARERAERLGLVPKRPEWLDKEVEKQELTDGEKKEIESILEGFK